MGEINLMDQYPRSKRPIEERAKLITEEHRAVARQFGKEFFDGDRLYGYGGYSYHPRFWQATVKRFRDYYQLAEDASVLDVGCGKGFLLHEMKEASTGLAITGIDLSEYAIEHSKSEIKPYLQVGNAIDLPFEDDCFDLVISINTIHNLFCYDLEKALKEIERVSRHNKYIVVESYRNLEEKTNLIYWVLTGECFFSPEEWEWWFNHCGYTGDHSFIYFE